jgi:hypothetical protein
VALADEQRIIETGQPMVGIEEKETWPDGHETWVSTSKVPIRDASGNVIGTFGLSRDITERKISNEAMANYARQQEAVSHLGQRGLAGAENPGDRQNAASRSRNREQCPRGNRRDIARFRGADGPREAATFIFTSGEEVPGINRPDANDRD